MPNTSHISAKQRHFTAQIRDNVTRLVRVWIRERFFFHFTDIDTCLRSYEPRVCGKQSVPTSIFRHKASFEKHPLVMATIQWG